MATQKRKKINRLIAEWPRGTVSVASYLKKRGFRHELLRTYKNSRWIESIGHGAFKLYGDRVDWTGGLYALQKQLDLHIHAGGKTALELKGYAHYISEKWHKVFLYGRSLQKMPTWFNKYSWDAEIVYSSTKLFPDSLVEGFSEFKIKEFAIKISSPERASMEMLYHVPNNVTFEEAFLIMENLMSLRPDVVQSLLEDCNSVKVKRLFMYMAEKHTHPWLANVNTSNVNFGKGKRRIVQKGMLDNKYLITVPKDYEREVS
jgi:hypothetical protein